MARAIWKGELQIGKQQVGVKLYSAIEDRSVHFHLLHEKDRAPVEQHIVRKDTGKDVPKEDMRKAFAVSTGTAVILQPEELEKLVPPESREIELCRFVAPVGARRSMVRAPLLSRAGWRRRRLLRARRGARAQEGDRHRALGHAQETISRRAQRVDGYLIMTTLRRADQVLSFSGVSPRRRLLPQAHELKLAEQLVSSIEADFDPEQWQNEYRERLCKLIEAKARGEKIEPVARKKKAPQASLADSLKASIAAAKERKVA